jgi:MFS family permease
MRARLRAATGGLPSAFWVLWWGVLVNRAASFVGGFLALFLVSERGFGVAAAGQVVALYGLGGMASSLVAGVLADRIGRRLTMVASLAVNAAAVGALAVAEAPWLVAAITLVAGASGQMYPPALNAAVADVVPFDERQRAFGLVYWAANVGFGIGYAVAGLVGPRSLPLLFLLDAASTGAFALLLALRLPETRPATGPTSAEAAGLGAVLADGVFLAFLGVHLVALLVFTQWEVVYPVDVAAHGVGRGGYGFLLWLNCVVVIVLQPLLAARLRQADPSRVLAASALLFGLGFGLGALGGSLPLYSAGVLLWTLGEVLGFPTASTLTAELAPPALRGRYQGLFVATWGAAFALSPLLSSALAERAGARAVWLACLAAGAASALGHLAAAGTRRRRLQGQTLGVSSSRS